MGPSTSFLLLLSLLLIRSCHTLWHSSEHAQHQQSSMRSTYRTSIREHFPFTNESIQQLVPIVPALRTSFDSSARYFILSGDDDGYFHIDPSNGDLYLMRQLDRESLPESAVGDRFSLVIQVTDGVKSVQTRVVVEVEDINDNRPRFHFNEHLISIVENLPVGFNVLQLTATDPDLGENGRFTFRLIDSSGAFTIDPITGWLSVNNSSLLDRERVERMILIVEVVEASPSLLPFPESIESESKFSSVQIDIELTDSNDNSPIFQPTNLYSFTVDAMAGTGTVVGQVEAVDADANENGLIFYAIQHQQEGEPTSRASLTHQTHRKKSGQREHVPFSIHPRSGHLIVTDAPLDQKSYTIFVEASDQPSNPSEQRHSLAIVKISVVLTDSDQHHFPKFSESSYQFRVAVSTPKNTPIGQVKTEGFQNNKNVRYSWKHQLRQPAPFTLDSRTGVLRVAGDLTRPASFTFNVTASGGRQDSITTTLTVNVLGEPMASSSILPFLNTQMFAVTENSPAGYIGQIIYNPLIKGNSNDPARRIEFLPLDRKMAALDYLIVSRNGSLYTRRPIDRELIHNNLTLFVTVLENGNNRDTLQVSVTILDVNDNAPVFSRQRYFGRVTENVSAGTQVQLSHPIMASDADSWPHDVIRFSLSGNGDHLFLIDSQTARISVLQDRSLDRERMSIYNLTVTASDGVFTSVAELDILIDDVDDQAPHISGFIPTIGVVALERAADRPELLNEGLIIVCADGSCSKPIDLEEKEPKQLAPGRMLATYSRFRNHLLQVLDDWIDVADRSTDEQSEEKILEHAFQRILYNSSILIHVPDDLPVDSSIGVFKTSDQDDRNSTNHRSGLRFGLSTRQSDRNIFAVIAETGSLILKKPLRREEVYLIGVQVMDREQGLRSETNIAIKSTDVNRHRPTFNRSFYELFVPEGDYNRTGFVSIEATDGDYGDSGRLSYSLISQTRHWHPFAINDRTGHLSITGLIDRETTEFFRFSVQATDAGFPPLKSLVEVVVYVTDINDNPPKFEIPTGRNRSEKGLQPLFRVTLTEGTPPGTPVIRVRATDADADVHTNANITYRLGSHHHLFSIDPIGGSIFTLDRLNRSRSDPEYNVLVVAADGGTPRLSTAGVVRVRVVPACHPDLSARRQQSVTLDENVPTPIALVNLTVGGKSKREAPPVQLSLLRIEPSSSSAQSLFKLDHSEPVLWLIEPLDREILDVYSVHLRVQRPGQLPDRIGGTNNNSGCIGLDEEELVLNIRVADVNDNPPVFVEKRLPVVVSVASSTSVGYPVISILATDADDGNNAIIKYSMFQEEEMESEEEPDLELRGGMPSFFSIEPRNGTISVASAIDRLTGRILSYYIKATDRNGTGLSTTLPLSIHILDRWHEMALVFDSPLQHILDHLENITRIVRDVSDMQVWIKSAEAHFEGDMSDSTMTDVVLYAKNQSSQLFVPAEYLTRILNQKWNELEVKLPNHLNLKDIRQPHRTNAKSLPISPHGKLDALEVTLIAMGAAVLLGALVAVLCIVMSRLNHKRRDRLVASPISMAMDYHHVQSVKNVTTSSCNDSSQVGLMSAGSSGSSEIYVEVPADSKNHLPFYVQSTYPAASAQHPSQRYHHPAMVTSICCPSCQPIEAKRKCLVQQTNELSPSHASELDSWALKRKIDQSSCRLHSGPPSCHVHHRHSFQTADKVDETRTADNQHPQLEGLQRSKSMRLDQQASSVRFKDQNNKRRKNQQMVKQRRCRQHGRRQQKVMPNTSTAQVHHCQSFNEQPIEFNRHQRQISTESNSTTETFDDSLESSLRHQRKKR